MPPSSPGALVEQAREFASELSEVASAFLGSDFPFSAHLALSRVAVAPEDEQVLPITIGGRTLLNVAVQYLCEQDAKKAYLAVRKSHIKVFAGANPKGDPLFRYEFVHDQREDLPAAHLHIHAHRDHFTSVMTLARELTGPSQQVLGELPPLNDLRMCEVHFPLGGSRFRPMLEDVLQMLVTEFGAQAGAAWNETLHQHRESYRRRQTQTVVRDCPEAAVDALRSLGYVVQEPASGPAPVNRKRLQSF